MSEFLKLDFNERSDGVSPLAVETLAGEELWRYPQRQVLQEKIARINQLQAEQVLCTNGGDEAIMILMRLINETARLILPLPAFSQYTWGVESWQLDAELVAPEQNLNIDVVATIEAISQSTGSGSENSRRNNSVTIITRPNNPTGELISEDALISILTAAKKSGGWVFLDEAYIEFSRQPCLAQSLLARFDNLVILRTLSKAFGLAGIRVGYIMGSQALIQEFEKRCMPFNIPQPSLTIATQALSQQNRLEVSRYCQKIIENRTLLTDWLGRMDITVLTSEANFITLRLPQKQSRALSSFLAKNNVLVRCFNEALLQECVRITIPCRLEKLQSLLQQVLRPELVCLDMDGVLIDTSGSYQACIAQTVAHFCGDTPSPQEIEDLKNAGGFNNDWVLSQRLLQLRGVEVTLEQVTAIFQRFYLGEDDSETGDRDGLVANEVALINAQLAAKFNQDQKLQFAIVTGRPKNEAIVGMALVGLEQLDLISLDDVTEPKPSPQGVQLLQRKYSTLSWMCGDNPDDMQAACASNSLAIGIGKTNADELYQAGADVVLDDINELENWL